MYNHLYIIELYKYTVVYISTMLIKLLSLLLTQNVIYKNNIINIMSSEIDIHKNDFLGYDERYVNYYTNITSHTSHKRETSDILNISRYMDILEKINKLQKANTLGSGSGSGPDIHDETIRTILYDETGHMNIRAYNIKAGGLLSDW